MARPSAIRRVGEVLWEIPRHAGRGMRVPARIFADEPLLDAMDDGVFDQAVHMAGLPGIVEAAWCMPDGHLGYGFPIGGVAAFDLDCGVISPGGIGFDINCGMRLVRTGLTVEEVAPRLRELVDALAARVPAGVGAPGLLALSRDGLRQVAVEGAAWCVREGMGWQEDLEHTENRGKAAGADPAAVSAEAIERGLAQVGTLGSGNHYLEIQAVPPGGIVDPVSARAFGIEGPGQVVVMFHCGSRGFGHQVATDYLRAFGRLAEGRGGIRVPDRGLACAPFDSREGRQYYAAMTCAINVSYANRQVILHRVREVFADVFHRDPAELGMRMVWDVSHNTAQVEEHPAGSGRKVLVHRKGATRSLGPGSPGLPWRYRDAGQPVIVGGSMETGSWLLAGTAAAGAAFSTTAHGAGRAMSRSQAKKRFDGRKLRADLERRGVIVRAASLSGLAEEAGGAYKDIDAVVAVAETAGLSRRVARLVPLGCVKG